MWRYNIPPPKKRESYPPWVVYVSLVIFVIAAFAILIASTNP